jgi:tripartite ATP-independent transporter DctM subunit
LISLGALVLFLVLLTIGAPIAVALGLSSIVTILLVDLPMQVIAQRTVNSIDSLPLLAVPMFIFAANIFNAVGLTDQIFDFTRLLIGRLRGGLAQVNVAGSLIFSGISGAALADIGGLGSMQIRLMKKQGYTPEFAAGITIASASIGPIFPPSIPLVIFAATAEVSAVKLLIAGILPALTIALFLMLQIAWMARKYNLPKDEMQISRSEIASVVVGSLPALFAPVLLVGGMLTGLFGPTEVAAITVLYGLVLGLVYRRLTWSVLYAAARETTRATASILIIVATAGLFAWVLTIEQVPAMISEMLLGISTNPLVLLLLVNILLLVVGMFMESIAAILILAPILVPPLAMAGVDPIQLGVVVVLNLMIGLLTPPVGMSLYMVSSIAKIPVDRVLKGTLPFFVPLLLALAAVSAFPGLSTFLPNLFFR